LQSLYSITCSVRLYQLKTLIKTVSYNRVNK